LADVGYKAYAVEVEEGLSSRKRKKKTLKGKNNALAPGKSFAEFEGGGRGRTGEKRCKERGFFLLSIRA